MTWSLMTHTFSCACQEEGNAPSLEWRVWSFEWERVKKMEGKIPGSLAQGLGETEISTPKLKIQEEEGASDSDLLSCSACRISRWRAVADTSINRSLAQGRSWVELWNEAL